ncbi:MAG: hypothetical protein LBK67_10010 [Coriobacteriales bacterium]|jgi:hypothetical protein|nr:hypothetical protein [Coriobacteriales bacterium]
MARPKGTTGISKEPRDPKKQIYNVNALFQAFRGSWQYGHCELVTQGGVTGFVFDHADEIHEVYRESLPTNFFSIELLNLNTEDCEELCGFISEWGAPYSPYREVSPEFVHSKEHTQGINDSRKLAKALEYGGVTKIQPEVISLREASTTLQDFSNLVRYMFYVLDGNPSHPFHDWYRIVWLAASNPLQICDTSLLDDSDLHVGDGALTPVRSLRYGLSTAIANQIIETVADPAPWYPCVACGHWFKRKRGAKRPSRTATVCQSDCRPPGKSRNVAISDTQNLRDEGGQS